jgi:hypothetical protein
MLRPLANDRIGAILPARRATRQRQLSAVSGHAFIAGSTMRKSFAREAPSDLDIVAVQAKFQRRREAPRRAHLWRTVHAMADVASPAKAPA